MPSRRRALPSSWPPRVAPSCTLRPTRRAPPAKTDCRKWSSPACAREPRRGARLQARSGNDRGFDLLGRARQISEPQRRRRARQRARRGRATSGRGHVCAEHDLRRRRPVHHDPRTRRGLHASDAQQSHPRHRQRGSRVRVRRAAVGDDLGRRCVQERRRRRASKAASAAR